ncbi:MAG: pantoate--beta-alanine ligase [Methylophilaceae bacterium]
MQIIHTVSELRNTLKNQACNSSGGICLVPTMGNLHAGHIKLAEIAKKHAKSVVVSIFVNPLQFGPNEDLASYPRTLDADCEKLKGIADIVFAPSASEMYPQAQTMTITPPPIADTLCGASRPGHFTGVATVVMKLFNIVQPTIAVFGKKDFQQLFIIQQLVEQFNLPIEIIAGETVREADGLALSSRNGYLSEKERAVANQLNQALQRVVQEIKGGKCEFDAVKNTATNALNAKGWDVGYIAICEASSLQPAQEGDKNLVVLGAAKLGKTRLIDNIEFNI